MNSFRNHLKKKLQDPDFKSSYDEERLLAELMLRIQEIREEIGFSQVQLAEKAGITQQQLSKIENGINCNISTFLKVCKALGLTVELKRSEYATTSA